MATNKLILTRSQIAAFVGDDPRAIKQLEQLFTNAQNAAQVVDVDALRFDIGTALAGVGKLSAAVAQLAQDEAIDASTALSVAQSAQRALAAVEALAMVGATLPPPVPVRRAVGAWHSNVTQSAGLPNVATAMVFGSTDIERGVWLDAATSEIITVADRGVYNFEFSAQLDKAGGGTANWWVWPRINGVDVPDSASQVRIQGNNAETVPAWNWLLELAPNDGVQLMWATDDVSVVMQYVPAAAPVPAIPSVILTVTQEG